MRRCVLHHIHHSRICGICAPPGLRVVSGSLDSETGDFRAGANRVPCSRPPFPATLPDGAVGVGGCWLKRPVFALTGDSLIENRFAMTAATQVMPRHTRAKRAEICVVHSARADLVPFVDTSNWRPNTRHYGVGGSFLRSCSMARSSVAFCLGVVA
jgi:hypothetical protein